MGAALIIMYSLKCRYLWGAHALNVVRAIFWCQMHLWIFFSIKTRERDNRNRIDFFNEWWHFYFFFFNNMTLHKLWISNMFLISSCNLLNLICKMEMQRKSLICLHVSTAVDDPTWKLYPCDSSRACFERDDINASARLNLSAFPIGLYETNRYFLGVTFPIKRHASLSTLSEKKN